MNKFGFIGYGRMGRALAAGALEASVLSTSSVCAFDVDPKARKGMKKDGVKSHPSIGGILRASDCVVLCVKPQQLRDLLRVLKEELKKLDKRILFVSIAAGFTLKKLTGLLGSGVPVIRVMPNTPAMFGEGMSVMSIGTGVTKKDVLKVKSLLSSVGKTALLPEKTMDAVTAVSGSGPAYVFYLAEAMIEAAQALGIQKDMAGELVKQTVFGAGKMLKIGSHTPSELRLQVTSKGGTTEAAINHLEGGKFKNLLKEALKKARRRSMELSRL